MSKSGRAAASIASSSIDISRWGRFQDIDESAYFEFICKRAGFPVHYSCRGSKTMAALTSVVLKNLTRVRAAGFSRELSKKMFLGQCNIVNLGFWRGRCAA